MLCSVMSGNFARYVKKPDMKNPKREFVKSDSYPSTNSSAQKESCVSQGENISKSNIMLSSTIRDSYSHASNDGFQTFCEENNANADIVRGYFMLNAISQEMNSLCRINCCKKNITILQNVLKEKLEKAQTIDLNQCDKGESESCCAIYNKIIRVYHNSGLKDDIMNKYLLFRKTIEAAYFYLEIQIYAYISLSVRICSILVHV